MRIKSRWSIIGLFLVLTLSVMSLWVQPTLGATAPPKRFSFSLVPPSCQDEDGCNICEIVKIFTNAADIISAVLSAAALLMFIFGGFMLIFSGGQPERVERGKKILIGTITGLGIVFLAWFAVNVIVRISASSGTNSSGGVDTTTKIFTQDWWEFNKCEPTLPISCAGLSVGELCGSGDCAGKTKSAACSCYRPINSDGDSNTCLSDGNTVDEANSKNKKCFCASQCTRLAKKSKRGYLCLTEKQAAAGYTTATGISCPDPVEVCALKK